MLRLKGFDRLLQILPLTRKSASVRPLDVTRSIATTTRFQTVKNGNDTKATDKKKPDGVTGSTKNALKVPLHAPSISTADVVTPKDQQEWNRHKGNGQEKKQAAESCTAPKSKMSKSELHKASSSKSVPPSEQPAQKSSKATAPSITPHEDAKASSKKVKKTKDKVDEAIKSYKDKKISEGSEKPSKKGSQKSTKDKGKKNAESQPSKESKKSGKPKKSKMRNEHAPKEEK
ncbi:unnamed protein product, partial [Mesorhabditis belari]|uniref:Uncharacterized protein n=1 Tax=Mesorhabditis belari TaxID=2138241 RepID=A0AAF3EWL0_9BILA